MNWISNFFASSHDCPDTSWDEDVLLVDVRSPREFAAGYVTGALNLPLDRLAQSYASALPDKSRQLVLYCQSGARSRQALQFLKQQNYLNLINGGSAGAVALKTNRPICRL